MELGSISHENRVLFLSTTHGAETSGLGAFMATLDFLEEHDVLKHVWQYGEELIKTMNDTASEIGISQGFKATGLGCLPYFQTFDQNGQWDSNLNTLFQQEMINQGVIMRSISIAYRHGDEELAITRHALEKSLRVLKHAYQTRFNPS